MLNKRGGNNGFLIQKKTRRKKNEIKKSKLHLRHKEQIAIPTSIFKRCAINY